jgi:hypothetical protein
MQEVIIRLLSRKFLISLVSLVGSIYLATTKVITGDQFLVFAGAIAGIYETSNVISKKLDK